MVRYTELEFRVRDLKMELRKKPELTSNNDENNKKNWREFRTKGAPHTNIKGENRQRTILVDEKLWRDFSVCVIKDKCRCRRNSDVIVELIKRYVEVVIMHQRIVMKNVKLIIFGCVMKTKSSKNG